MAAHGRSEDHLGEDGGRLRPRRRQPCFDTTVSSEGSERQRLTRLMCITRGTLLLANKHIGYDTSRHK